MTGRNQTEPWNLFLSNQKINKQKDRKKRIRTKYMHRKDNVHIRCGPDTMERERQRDRETERQRQRETESERNMD